MAKEAIPILSLSVDQLQYLVFNKAFEGTISKPLQNCKNIFVIGCMVGLRYKDLIKLKLQNIEERDGCSYLKVKSKKTCIDTLVKLPGRTLEVHKHCQRIEFANSQAFKRLIKKITTLILIAEQDIFYLKSWFAAIQLNFQPSGLQ